MPADRNYETAVKIGPATVGIRSNSAEILPVLPPPIEVASLLTDFYDIQEIPYADDLDGYIRIQDTEDAPHYSFSGDTLFLSGPLRKMAQEASDPRFSLWGNLGLLFRLTLFLLEKKHRIYNFHACALYQEGENSLFIFIGGAGSGKTVYLLSGIARGLKLFSTETVHLQITDSGPRWLMGSLVDNIRWGSLWYDFPQFKPDIPPPTPGRIWQEKIALDLSSYRARAQTLRDVASVALLFPRVEQGRKGFLMDPITDMNIAARLLCQNLSEKISQTFILYDRISVTGFEEAAMAERRLQDILEFIQSPCVTRIASILTNPEECWGDLLL